MDYHVRNEQGGSESLFHSGMDWMALFLYMQQLLKHI
jgi:hypothetical protein